jgi:preprotein translocase subunit SecF
MWILSAIALIFFFDRIKASRELPGYNKLGEAGLAQAGFKESFKKNLIVFALSAASALALLIGTADAMIFAAASIVSLLTGALNAVFVAPALYAAFKENKKPVKRIAAPKEKKQPVEEIEAE